jgi:hypothetical protein
MRRSIRTLSMLVAVGLGTLVLSAEAGCVKRKTGLSNVEKEQIKAYVLDNLPDDVTHKTDVNFDDKIHLVGWKATPEKAEAGSTIHFSLYWKKTGDLDPGWMLFTHITGDDPKDSRGNLDCVGAIRVEKKENCGAQLYGPSDWEKDKVIVDSFDYTMPTADKINSKVFRFLVGAWKGDSRLHIKNAEANDGDNRANVVVLPTGWTPPENAPPKVETPQLVVPKFGKADTIKIDGKLDEPAWQKAAFTGPFVQPGDGNGALPDYPVNSTAKLAWDDQNLYVAFNVADKAPDSPFKPTDKDPHIWEKSSGVELMIQPGDFPDNKDYYEIQVDTKLAIWDTHFDDYNQPINADKGEFGHMEWSAGVKSAVTLDKEKGYVLEVAVPWKSFDKPRVAAPPAPGDSWRINLYSFRDGQGKALAWSPILGKGNFHFTQRFAKVTFTGEPGANPAPSGSAMPDLKPPIKPMPLQIVPPKPVQ